MLSAAPTAAGSILQTPLHHSMVQVVLRAQQQQQQQQPTATPDLPSLEAPLQRLQQPVTLDELMQAASIQEIFERKCRSVRTGNSNGGESDTSLTSSEHAATPATAFEVLERLRRRTERLQQQQQLESEQQPAERNGTATEQLEAELRWLLTGPSPRHPAKSTQQERAISALETSLATLGVLPHPNDSSSAASYAGALPLSAANASLLAEACRAAPCSTGRPVQAGAPISSTFDIRSRQAALPDPSFGWSAAGPASVVPAGDAASVVLRVIVEGSSQGAPELVWQQQRQPGNATTNPDVVSAVAELKLAWPLSSAAAPTQ